MMNYSWTLVSPVNGSEISFIHNILASLPPSADRVDIPGKHLDVGKNYTFKVGVANFLTPGRFEMYEHTVTKGSLPTPEISIVAPLDASGEIFVSDALTLTGKAKVSKHVMLNYYCLGCYVNILIFVILHVNIIAISMFLFFFFFLFFCLGCC